MISIPLSQWLAWSDEERSQLITYYETINKKWYIDCTKPIDHQKDHDEYIEEMSIGGRPFKP